MLPVCYNASKNEFEGRCNMTIPARRQFTVDDYHEMMEAGIFSEDDRLELLCGDIREMSPIGPTHVAIVNRLNSLLNRILSEKAIVSVQNPIRLSLHDEPEPDIALLKPRDDFYSEALATPDEVFLVIEVADASLAYERDVKLPRYAAAAIPEVWLVDVEARQVARYTEPRDEAYRARHLFAGEETITSAAVPDLSLVVDAILPGR